MIVVLGEILVDLFEAYQRVGGAPFNFAFHLKQLFPSVRLITRIGRDGWGDKITDLLKKHHFDLSDVQIDDRHPTGTVQVTLDDQGVPEFDIREDVAYDYINLEKIESIQGPETRMIYFGSLAQRSDRAFEQFERLLSHKEESAKIFCDINLRPPHVRQDVIHSALHHADVLKLNTDELTTIGRMLGHADEEAPLARYLMKHFDIEVVILTKGEKGSVAYRGAETFHAPLPKPEKIVDTVGAGDAFAAVMAAGYLRDLPLQDLLVIATQFAAGICALPGAIPDDMTLYDHLRLKLEGDAHV